MHPTFCTLPAHMHIEVKRAIAMSSVLFSMAGCIIYQSRLAYGKILHRAPLFFSHFIEEVENLPFARNYTF